MVYCSFLIPVFRGERYITEVITSCLNQNDPDIEVLVSIDSDDDESFNLAKDFKDPRLKIFRGEGRKGMLGNYQFLIENAQGQWISIVGQDDGVLPFAVCELRRISLENSSHEIVVSRRAYANWPSSSKPTEKYRFIYPLDLRTCKIKSASRFLNMAMSGYREYSEGPQLYTGSFVCRKLILRIASLQGGNFFIYPIPDVSSSVSLLSNTGSYIYSPIPLFWIGTSESSTGVAIDALIDARESMESEQFLKESCLGSGSEEMSSVPGRGVFTSFSWYIFEAYELLRKCEMFRSKFKFLLALAALQIENPQQWREAKRESSLKINDLRDIKFLDGCVVSLLKINLSFFRKMRSLNRHVTAIWLKLNGRLYLQRQDIGSKLTFQDISSRIHLNYSKLR